MKVNDILTGLQSRRQALQQNASNLSNLESLIDQHTAAILSMQKMQSVMSGHAPSTIGDLCLELVTAEPKMVPSRIEVSIPAWSDNKQLLDVIILQLQSKLDGYLKDAQKV